jgi:hypothetical protein
MTDEYRIGTVLKESDSGLTVILFLNLPGIAQNHKNCQSKEIG